MDYAQVETDIVDKLISDLGGGYIIVPLPEKESDYNPQFSKPRITVAYHSSQFHSGNSDRRGGSVRSTDPISQEEEANIEVIIESRSLRDPDTGVYPTINKCRKALLGFRPKDCDRMSLVKQEIIDKTNGTFMYMMMFQTISLVVEDFSEPTEPLLTEVTWKETIQ